MHRKGSPPPFLDPQSSCQAAALRCKSIRSGRRSLVQAADKSDGQSVRQLQLFSPAGGVCRMEEEDGRTLFPDSGNPMEFRG